MKSKIKNLLKVWVKTPLKSSFRQVRHKLGYALSRRPLRSIYKPANRPRILIVGVYVSSARHLAAQLCAEFNASKHCTVKQCWASLGRISPNPYLARHTSIECLDRIPKFELLNRLLSGVDLTTFDFILCSDDDVSVRPGFLDTYVALQQTFGFSICQPARSWTSSIDHPFVRRNPALLGRQTRFVEIGPIFSFDRKVSQKLIPFDLSTPMGWGYDYVWPVQIAELGLTMGIIDETAVDHTIRPRGAIYSSNLAAQQGTAYREKHKGLMDRDAFVELKRFPR
jgi:hypothetical protein